MMPPDREHHHRHHHRHDELPTGSSTS